MTLTRHDSLEESPALVLLPDGGMRLFTRSITLEQARRELSAECGGKLRGSFVLRRLEPAGQTGGSAVEASSPHSARLERENSDASRDSQSDNFKEPQTKSLHLFSRLVASHAASSVGIPSGPHPAHQDSLRRAASLDPGGTAPGATSDVLGTSIALATASQPALQRIGHDQLSRHAIRDRSLLLQGEPGQLEGPSSAQSDAPCEGAGRGRAEESVGEDKGEAYLQPGGTYVVSAAQIPRRATEGKLSKLALSLSPGELGLVRSHAAPKSAPRVYQCSPGGVLVSRLSPLAVQCPSGKDSALARSVSSDCGAAVMEAINRSPWTPFAGLGSSAQKDGGYGGEEAEMMPGFAPSASATSVAATRDDNCWSQADQSRHGLAALGQCTRTTSTALTVNERQLTTLVLPPLPGPGRLQGAGAPGGAADLEDAESDPALLAEILQGKACPARLFLRGTAAPEQAALCSARGVPLPGEGHSPQDGPPPESALPGLTAGPVPSVGKDKENPKFKESPNWLPAPDSARLCDTEQVQVMGAACVLAVVSQGSSGPVQAAGSTATAGFRQDAEVPLKVSDESASWSSRWRSRHSGEFPKGVPGACQANMGSRPSPAPTLVVQLNDNQQRSVAWVQAPPGTPSAQAVPLSAVLLGKSNQAADPPPPLPPEMSVGPGTARAQPSPRQAPRPAGEHREGRFFPELQSAGNSRMGERKFSTGASGAGKIRASCARLSLPEAAEWQEQGAPSLDQAAWLDAGRDEESESGSETPSVEPVIGTPMVLPCGPKGNILSKLKTATAWLSSKGSTSRRGLRQGQGLDAGAVAESEDEDGPVSELPRLRGTGSGTKYRPVWPGTIFNAGAKTSSRLQVVAEELGTDAGPARGFELPVLLSPRLGKGHTRGAHGQGQRRRRSLEVRKGPEEVQSGAEWGLNVGVLLGKTAGGRRRSLDARKGQVKDSAGAEGASSSLSLFKSENRRRSLDVSGGLDKERQNSGRAHQRLGETKPERRRKSLDTSKNGAKHQNSSTSKFNAGAPFAKLQSPRGTGPWGASYGGDTARSKLSARKKHEKQGDSESERLQSSRKASVEVPHGSSDGSQGGTKGQVARPSTAEGPRTRQRKELKDFEGWKKTALDEDESRQIGEVWPAAGDRSQPEVQKRKVVSRTSFREPGSEDPRPTLSQMGRTRSAHLDGPSEQRVSLSPICDEDKVTPVGQDVALHTPRIFRIMSVLT